MKSNVKTVVFQLVILTDLQQQEYHHIRSNKNECNNLELNHLITDIEKLSNVPRILSFALQPFLNKRALLY